MHCFSGLSYSEAGRLDKFLHLSEPKSLKKKSILENGDLNPAIDFLDVLQDDIPKGETADLGLTYTKISCHLQVKTCDILQNLLQVFLCTRLYPFYFILGEFSKKTIARSISQKNSYIIWNTQTGYPSVTCEQDQLNSVLSAWFIAINKV